MKTVVITGIDSVGKTTEISKLPWKNVRKYPNNPDIKEQINRLYRVLIQSGPGLHNVTISNVFRTIHDLYDKDFRIPFPITRHGGADKEPEDVLIFDRYFIDNVVYSRMNGVERASYSEEHFFVPDLVIMLKVRNYSLWKSKFVLKGDENIREPAVLFNEVQHEIQDVLKEMEKTKKIKKYTIIEGLAPETNQKIVNAISTLLT